MISLEFAHPLWLLAALATTGATALFLWFTERQARKRLARFVSADLMPRLASTRSTGRTWFRHCLFLLAIFLLGCALARPQWGAIWQKAETRGIDIMIALDTSRSMLAEDIVPNRLERSKLAILDLLEVVKGDRVGLIAFAGNAFLQCPLTLDTQAFRQTLAALDTETIPVGGTDVASAIEEAEAYFEKTGNDRILILITDGEDLGEAGLERARAAGARGTRIITVGVGSPKGELIPIRGPDGQQDFLRDAQGNPVSTALDAQTLVQIAEATGGVYSLLGPTGSGLTDAYEFSLSQAESTERNEMLQRIPVERFQWPLLAALLLLVAEALVSNRRRIDGSQIRSALAALMGAGALLTPPDLQASASEAAKAFEAQRYEEAVSLYREALVKDPDDRRLAYNLGVAAYRADAFESAITAFDKIIRSQPDRLTPKAFFNLGNSRVAAGFAGLEETPELTRGLWEAALADYRNAIALKPNYGKAQQNLTALEAAIAAHTFTLLTAAEPPQGGSVTEGQAAFYKVPVPIEAKAAEGWEFAGWDGDNIAEPDQPATRVSLTGDQTVTARFAKVWDLEVRSANAEAGSAEASGTFREGTPVPLKAIANDYFAFSGWTIEGEADIADPSAAETEITLRGDSTATAAFVEAFKLSVNVDPEIGGKAGPSGFFEEYSVVPIQAQPRDGFEWVSWNGFGVKDPDQAQTSVALTSDRIVIAQMKRIWNLVIIPQPEEGGSSEGAGNHRIGSTVPINAIPADGYSFVRWEGPAVADPASAATSVTVESTEHTLFAIFSKDESDENGENNDSSNSDSSESDSSSGDSSDSGQPPSQGNEPESPQESQGDEPPAESEDRGEQETPEKGEAEEPEEPEPENGAPEAPEAQADDASEKAPVQAGDANSQPIQMSREEARQLLNALSEEERFLPAGEANERIDSRASPRSEKDW